MAFPSKWPLHRMSSNEYFPRGGIARSAFLGMTLLGCVLAAIVLCMEDTVGHGGDTARRTGEFLDCAKSSRVSLTTSGEDSLSTWWPLCPYTSPPSKFCLESLGLFGSVSSASSVCRYISSTRSSSLLLEKMTWHPFRFWGQCFVAVLGFFDAGCASWVPPVGRL